MTVDQTSVRFIDVLRVRSFVVLYGAEMQSIVGDQLARIALSVLVFSRTGSDVVTALTYGLTYLPAIAGGVVLARIGDRFSRRWVMIGCDVLRAVAFAAMSVSGIPLVVVGALLIVAVFVGPAFSASAVSLLAARLTTAEFRSASALRITTNQLAQVVGFAVGGALVAEIGAHATLLVNSLTYVVSMLLLGLLLERVAPGSSVASGPPAADSPAEPVRQWQDASGTAVLMMVWRRRSSRRMLTISLLAGLFVVPEGLAIPFAQQIGASTGDIGLLLAAIPLGSALGVVFLTRIVRATHRNRIAMTMAAVAGVPLVFTVLAPHVWVAGALWFISGFATAYQVEAFVTLVGAVPDEIRATLLSVIGSLLLGSQGIGPLLFGAVASVTSASTSVAAAGGIGSVIAAAVLLGALTNRHGGRHSARVSDQ